MKKFKQIISALLIFAMIFATSCTKQPSNVVAPEGTIGAEGEISNEDNLEDMQVDLVVVGGGMAGLSSSIEAARLGAKVVLLEKLSFLGGSSALCEGYIWSSDSKLNQETGQGFDADTMVEYLNFRNSGEGNLDLIKNIIGISGEVLDTYMEEGLRLNNDKFTFGDVYEGNYLMPFTAPDQGAGMIQDLKKIAESKGVDIRVSSPVIGLITENNEVVGVEVEGKEGKYNIYAGTVVLATGGFVNNEELMQQYNPLFAENSIVSSTAGAEGDAHKMVLELGGSFVGKNVSGTYSLNDAPAHNLPFGLLLYGSNFSVNKEGVRFCRENGVDEDGDNYYMAVNKQTGSRAYAIFDSKHPKAEVLEDAAANGLALKADTLEELADMAGIDYEALAKEVELYNNDFNSGKDDSKWGIPNASMTPLVEGPFYVGEIRPWNSMMTLTGVKVNENCQVLGENDEPIKNLYGAGEFILGNIVYDRYPSCGTALASGLYGGVVAVRHALHK